MSDLSVLMPVYNEQETIEEAIEGVLAATLPVGDFELVVVNDGSSDRSREILDGRDWPENVRVFHHERNRGKGAAVRTALEHARGRYSLVMDADLEYDPRDLYALVEPLLSGRAEVVFGTRAFQAHTAYGFWYVLGNKGLTFIANFLYNCWLSDINACQKVLPTELFRSLDLREDGFTMESEMTAKLALRGVRIYEVPVVYAARSREEGKKLTALDGLRALMVLIRCRLAGAMGRGRA